MDQFAPTAFRDCVRLVPVSEFVRLCSDAWKRIYELRGSHSYAAQRNARALRNAMTGLCMVELIEAMPDLESKRQSAVKAGNDALARHS